jgi:glycosyltransferase involved in cell wall biosynthesis
MIDPRAPDYSNTPASDRRPEFDFRLADSVDRPLVTIVTPFFNGGDEFHETARCVFRQSLQQWEWLIVNDGSSEPHVAPLIESYAQRDARIRVIEHSENRGLPAARNTGFQAAKSPYIFQLDADDLIEPTTLEKCLWFLETRPEYAWVKGCTVGFGGQQYLAQTGLEAAERFLEENLVTATCMVRRDMHAAVGGYDESIRGGMEDWDFWLRCAARGYWGATIPELLDWYRRRETHGDRWADLASEKKRKAFQAGLKQRYPKLYNGGFPRIASRRPDALEANLSRLHGSNVLHKSKPRLLMILPWLRMGGSDRFNLDLLTQLTQRGWEITIATTLSGPHPWTPLFARYTPDIFALGNTLDVLDQPAFLRYLIESRRPDVVMVSNSENGYLLLPFLRAACPEPTYVDYSHMEQEEWKDGGYPRYGVRCQDLLDLNMVTSQHLKGWMVSRGATDERIEVATINVDPEYWQRDTSRRQAIRRQYHIDDDTPLIIYAVRICPQKQPRVFAKVMQEMVKRGVRFRAFVAGDGEDRPWLEQYLTTHKLTDHVHMLGEMSIEQMHGLLSASDVFFLPSQWEGIAMALYEAMSMGLAFVGADVGGQRELVDDTFGLLLPRGTEEEEVQRYAGALEKLLADPQACRELGRTARERVASQFNLDLMGDRMIALLEHAQMLRREQPRDPVPCSLGKESAYRALEYLRTSEDLDWLTQQARAHGAATPGLSTGAMAGWHDLMVHNELHQIEDSRSWRFVQSLKRSALYKLTARLRYGAEQMHAVDESPAQRLERIKHSNAYRLIQAAKRNPMYRWYARRKYGADFDQSQAV